MMNALSSFMPGEHDWMKQTAPTGAAAGIMPQKKSPVMNALGAAFQILAPEGYERGRQAKMSREIGNALSRDNYQDAAKVAYGAGDWQTGMQLGQYGQNQQDAQRKREAQGALQLFTSLQPGQVTQYAMEDPAGFERMTGMSSDEYMQMGQRFTQMGVTPEQFADYVVKQAQAELGITPTQKDPLVVNNRVLDPNDPSRVLGDYSDPLVVNDQIVDRSNYGVQADLRTPQAPKYSTATTDNGVIAYNTADPTQTRNLGPTPVKTPLVTNTYNAPDNKGETKFQEGLGTNAANSYQAILEEGRAAGGSIGNLDTMETLLDGIDYTGLGGDALLRIQRLGAMFGADIPDLAPKEALKRLSSQMALSLKQDLPGPMSNADREFLLSIPPNLNVSPTGNDAILFILRKREERKQDMMRSLIEANPQTMEEYRMWENNYLQSAPPMFNAATQASLLAALSGASGEDIPQ